MQRRTIRAVALSMALLDGTLAHAQQRSRFEIGGQLTLIRYGAVRYVLTSGSEVGGGGRLAWQVARVARVEGEVDIVPRDANERGTQTYALFGVVAGPRGRRAGIFGKARVGLVHYAHPTPPPGLVGGASFDATNPAVDLGGVLELYPASRVIVRIDAGDTIVRVGNICRAVLGGCPTTATQHNLQVTAGAGWRF